MRTRIPMLVIVVLATLASIAPASADDGDLWADESFENGTDVFNTGGWGMEELATGHVGAGLRSIIPAGEHWGSSGHWDFGDHGIQDPEELYWRYYLKFPAGFYIDPPDRGKLPGPANLYTYNCLGGRVSTASAPCWSARMLFSRDYLDDEGMGQNGPSDRTLLGFYTYHLDGPTNRGDIVVWDDDVALLDHGRWYCVEGRIDLNTPGQNDGVLEGWVDGEQAFSRSDFRWRRSTEGFLDVDSFWFDIYYGGDPSAVRNEIHFDSLALGPERIGCDDAFTYDGSFWDDDGSVFEQNVEWLAASGVTKGCNPPTNDQFCPDANVTRGQMAAFLVRALDLPAGGDDMFTDDDASVFEADIDSLASSGVTPGCGPGRFCPDGLVTRGQMAAFLNRALGDVLVAGEPTTFSDTVGTTFEADIAWLSATGVTSGCGGDRFCPDDLVTRGQMAAFLHRALGDL